MSRFQATARSDRGFTLIELLVGVVIVSALAAIAIPATLAQRSAAVDARTTSDVRSLALWEAVLVEQTGTGAAWSTSEPLPVSLSGYRPSADTVLVASTLAGAWCVAGWALDGRHHGSDDAIWADSTTRSVQTTQPASAACGALVPPVVVPPTGGGGGTPVGGAFAKAVYSAGAVSFTNTWTVAGINADLYVGGNFHCSATVHIYGKVVATGNAYLTNSCRVDGDLWTGGTLSMDSGSHVLGSARAAGNVTMTTGTLIDGDLTTPGSVTFSATPHVGGTVYAGGPVTIANATTQHAGGDIRTGATFSSNKDFLGRPAVQAVVVGGAIYEHVATPVIVDPPPAVVLPPAPYTPSQWTGFTALTWAGWVNAAAIANAAPSWSTMRSPAPGCTAASASYSVNGPITVTADTVVDARQSTTGCSAITLQQIDLRMSADLVVYADSFKTTNGWTTTSTDGLPHTLRVIVPGLVAACASGRDIDLGTGTVMDPKIQTLLYSPAKIHIEGTATLFGQVVGGCISSTGTTTINYQPVTVPGW